MLAVLLALTLRYSAAERPALPMGSSPVIAKAVNHIAELTEKADFAGAKTALKLLPSRKVRIQWDDSGAPEASRFDFARVRDQVLNDWTLMASLISYEVVKQDGDLKVTFAEGPETKLMWSEDPKQPRLTVQIGLKDGDKPVDPATVNNKFSYGIGSYNGVSKLPMAGYLMSDPELSNPVALRPNRMETSIASGTVTACEKIRAAVMESTVIKSGLPSISGSADPIDLGKVLQGDILEMKFSVKNVGKAPLYFQVIPDCSCFTPDPMKMVALGEEVGSVVTMNTTEFFGSVNKKLYLFSNDPEHPVRPIPVAVSITPRYRILPPMKTYIADENGITVDAYMYFPANSPMRIQAAESQGLPGQVKFAKWEGELADPDLGEGALSRRGYKITATLKNIPDGSQFGTNIVLTTDDPSFPKIYYPLYVQKGIVASPPNIYYGEIGAATRTVTLTVARPGQPFEITGTESDSAHLAVSFKQAMAGDQPKPGEYKVTVIYDGKAAAGDYRATITIRTNDPKQKVISVPVTAIVRKQ